MHIRCPDEIICEKYGIKIPIWNCLSSLYVNLDKEDHICRFAYAKHIGYDDNDVAIIYCDDVEHAKNIEVILI